MTDGFRLVSDNFEKEGDIASEVLNCAETDQRLVEGMVIATGMLMAASDRGGEFDKDYGSMDTLLLGFTHRDGHTTEHVLSPQHVMDIIEVGLEWARDLHDAGRLGPLHDHRKDDDD